MLGKREVRQAFRDAVFERAGYRCQGPGCTFTSSREKAETDLDAHHIQNRKMFKFGGYVLENGIALCSSCHLKAERFHCTGESYPGFSPEDLYGIIRSSKQLAEKADSFRG